MSVLLTMLPSINEVTHHVMNWCASCVKHPKAAVPAGVGLGAGAAGAAAAAAGIPSLAGSSPDVPGVPATNAPPAGPPTPLDLNPDGPPAEPANSDDSAAGSPGPDAAHPEVTHWDAPPPPAPTNPYAPNQVAPNQVTPNTAPDAPTPTHLAAGPPMVSSPGSVPGPAGTTITTANGQVTVTSADGATTTAVQTGGGAYTATLSDGSTLTMNADHSASIQLPDGSTQNWNANGTFNGVTPPTKNWATQGAGGASPTITHDVTVPMNGGGYRIDHPDGSSDIHWPDGSVVHVNPDGIHWTQVRGPGAR